MAIPNLLKDQKYPFIFSLFALLIFVTFLLISNTQSPISIPISLSSVLDPSLSPPPPPPSPSASSSTPSPDPIPSTVEQSNFISPVEKWTACRGDQKAQNLTSLTRSCFQTLKTSHNIFKFEGEASDLHWNVYRFAGICKSKTKAGIYAGKLSAKTHSSTLPETNTKIEHIDAAIQI